MGFNKQHFWNLSVIKQFFFITIKANNSKFRRHFSFSSSPTEKGYLEFSTKLRESEFKNLLRKYVKGDRAILKAPFGDFTLDDKCDKIAMLAGGIGITNLRSICKYCTDNRLPTNIILLYCNHAEGDIAFRDDFDNMVSLNKNLKVIHIILEPSNSWKGYTGYITADILKDEIPDHLERTFFLSGPRAMNESMENLLLDLNVPKQQVRKETFTGY